MQILPFITLFVAVYIAIIVSLGLTCLIEIEDLLKAIKNQNKRTLTKKVLHLLNSKSENK